MFDLSDLSSLGNLAEQMKAAYGSGMSAMNEAGDQVAKEMTPDHQIEVAIQLAAKVEGHSYKVDSIITFAIELAPVLQSSNSPMGDLSSLLDGLDVDLGDDKSAVMEQLGQPRVVGVVKKINTKELIVSDEKGQAAKIALNQKATILATFKNNKILFNFEGVFSYPDHPNLFIAIPSMEKMQKNIVVAMDELYKKVNFSWTEKDKDNLSVKGSLKISKI